MELPYSSESGEPPHQAASGSGIHRSLLEIICVLKLGFDHPLAPGIDVAV